MKKVWILIALAVVVWVSAGLTGCQKKEKATGTEAMETMKEEAMTAEKAATSKPKDHPAH